MNLRRLAIPPLVLIILWAAAVWFPTRSMIAAERDRLDDIRSEQLARVATLDELTTAAELTSLFEADLIRFGTAVPDQISMAELLRQLDSEADAAGVRVELFAPTEIVVGTGILGRRPVPTGMSAVGLALTGQGSFEASMEFIERLERLSRLVVIDRLGLRTVDDGADGIIIDIEFRVFTSDIVVSAVGSDVVPVEPLTEQEIISMERDETLDRGLFEDPVAVIEETR